MARARSLLRVVGLVVGGVALALGLTVLVLPLWLRTGQGHRTVERVLTKLLNERVPGRVTVGRLGGSVARDLYAGDVVVYNPRGDLVGHAEWMSARWRPLALWRRHEIDELRAMHPVIALDRGSWRELPPPKPPRRPGKGVLIGRIIAVDGQVSWKRAVFHHVSGVALLRSQSNLDVHEASARVAGLEWRASGVVGWGVSTPAWVATRFEFARPEWVNGVGDVFYTPGRLEGDIDELTIAAPVATRLVGGRGALRVRGGVRGAPDRLRAEAHAAQAGRTLQLSALVDAATHSATIDARLRGVRRPIGVHAEARYDQGTLTLPSLHAAVGKSHVDGSGRLGAQRVQAAAELRLAPSEARLVGLRPTMPLRAHVALDGTTRNLGVDARASASPGRLTLNARVDLTTHRGHGTVVVRDLEPAQLIGHGPKVALSAALAFDGRWAHRALVGEATIARGRVVFGGRAVDQLAGAATVHLARAGQADLHRLGGRWAGKRFQPRLALRGLLHWSGERIDLTRASAAVGDSEWRGDAHWHGEASGGGHAQLRADAVTLAPALVARLIGHRPPAAWKGSGLLEGTPSDFAVHVNAATELGPALLAARVRRGGDTVELSAVELRLGDSRLRGAARFGRRRLTASLEEAVAQPALLRHLLPALDPQWPVRLHGSADGPLDGVDVHLRLDAGPSIGELFGRVSVPAQRFHLAGMFDGLDLSVVHKSQSRVRATLQLAASGRFAGGHLAGTLSVRDARGYALLSPFSHGLAEARFDGNKFDFTRLRVQVPGAKIAGRGGGSYSDFRIEYGAAIINALSLRHVPRSVRLLLGINGILPGRTIEGTIERHRGQKVVLAYRVLPIGFAQLAFLYRVVTGRVPFD